MRLRVLLEGIGPLALMRFSQVESPAELSGIGDLVVEPKADGWLCQAVTGEDARVYTRNGVDKTDRLPGIVKELRRMRSGCMIVGELIFVGRDGKQSFSKVSSVLSSEGGDDGGVILVAFDIIFYDWEDVSSRAWGERRKILERVVRGDFKRIRLSKVYRFIDIGDAVKESLGEGGEGVVIKDMNSPFLYSSMGSREPKTDRWWKWKLKERSDDFVVYKRRHSDKKTLIVDFGQYWGDKLYHVGSIDNFDEKTVKKIEGMKLPFVIEIEYQERTKEGKLRHPRFTRIRHDKNPIDVTMPEKYEGLKEI